MNKKSLTIINAILVCLLVVLDVLYITLKNPYIFKTLASSMFVVIGLFNLIITCITSKKHNLYCYFLFAGLIFAFLGDILLIDYFMLGAIFFGIGHVFYFVAFCFVKKINLMDLVYSVIIIGFALAVIFGYQNFNFKGMLPVIVCYAIIISLMLGKATANSRIKNKNRLVINLIWLGALLFFISDMFLLFNVFGGAPRVVDILCLLTYYPAQGLLATSIWYIIYVNNSAKNENLNKEVLQKEKSDERI